jgi:hypothetical protein
MTRRKHNPNPKLKMSNKANWWAYVHSNGSVHVKPWHGDHNDYTTDCVNNPFTKIIFTPFHAGTASEALMVVVEQLACSVSGPPEATPPPPDNVWGEDKEFCRQDWHREVSEGNTNLGYWEWVSNSKEWKDTEEEDEEDEDFPV